MFEIDDKKQLIFGIIAVVGVVLSFPSAYRYYLKESTKEIDRQFDEKRAMDTYGYCSTRHGTLTGSSKPTDDCISFFTNYASGKFKNLDPDSKFPINFMSASDFKRFYQSIQNDLYEFSMEELPPIEEITSGAIRE